MDCSKTSSGIAFTFAILFGLATSAGSAAAYTGAWNGGADASRRAQPQFRIRPRYIDLTVREAARSLERGLSVPVRALTTHTALTLQDCRTLALGRNLALEIVALESLTKRSVARSYRAQIFPRLVASGELSTRDRLPFSFSEILGREGEGPSLPGSGTGVNQFSRGRDLGTWRYSLEARWNPTDAALAHYLMRSTRNEAVKETLLRIRVAQKLVSTVDAAFYRLLSLVAVLPRAEALVANRQELARRARELHHDDLYLMEDLHRLDRKWIQARGLARSLYTELDLQREYLGAAMSLAPESLGEGGFSLAGEIRRPPPPEPLAELERKAIESRPEAYQAGLDHLIAVNDLKRATIKAFPQLTGFKRYTRDIDKHLLFNDIQEHGMYVHFDVVDWMASRAERRAARHKRDKTRSEIATVALGIASQVREAALKYRSALAEVDTAEALLESARSLIGTLRDRTSIGAQAEFSLLESEGDLIQEEIASIRALGEANAQRAELEGALGTSYTEALPR